MDEINTQVDMKIWYHINWCRISSINSITLIFKHTIQPSQLSMFFVIDKTIEMKTLKQSKTLSSKGRTDSQSQQDLLDQKIGMMTVDQSLVE